MGWLYNAFGYVLNFIYGIVRNYGVSIILLTLFIKIILLPLTLKQQKSMTKMQRIQPKLKEIQEKYKDDKDKSAQETMKLYKEYGVSPMGGCLPMLIQFPILIAFYNVIRKPVEYVLGIAGKELTALFKEFGINAKDAGAQIQLAEKMHSAGEGGLDFNFLGLDLAEVPWDELKLIYADGKINWIVLTVLIIPILACVTTYLTSKISTAMNKTKNEEKKEETKPQRILSPEQKKSAPNTGESMTKSMTYMMPLMTLFFTFTLPAAMGLYWTVSNVLSMVQTILLNSYYNKKMAVEIEDQDKIREAKIQEKIKKYNMKKKRG